MDDYNAPFGANDISDKVAADGLFDDASAEYLGRWNRLVSTTNWEKGRIISEWRQRLLAAEAPLTECSDEAWSRRVGNVSPQHVGRLRRAWEQFGQTFEQYPGLYWSHFQATLDWHDAVMWLEGAVQSRWSVAEMRRQRAAVNGEPVETALAELSAAEVDEDAAEPAASQKDQTVLQQSLREVQPFEPDFGDESNEAGDESPADEPPFGEIAEAPRAEPIRPFAGLPELPADLHDAFESFKLAILHHKTAGWRDVRCDDVLAALDGLKRLAMAPSEG